MEGLRSRIQFPSSGEGRNKKSAEQSAARAALEQASKLVTIPNAGGRYSSQILPDPDAVLDVRQRLAEAIETLSRR
mgnify:CR=1 FL=1